ncbi:MAG TPA: ATP-binding protein [Polyangiaceae bacterium]|jgi:chemotaxis family two-component system sensor kinase Cph1|nr:ATP-binding protein [Polyangiaceae bacterium]
MDSGTGSDPLNVNLAECDREPIHIPGAIQGHGALIAMTEPELTIAHVSANVATFLGVEAAWAIGKPLADVAGESTEAAVTAALRRDPLTSVNPVPIVLGERTYDGILHRNGVAAILELEPSAEPTASDGELLRPAFTRLQSATSLPELLATAVAEIRALTGFDRVMAYRFHEGGEGEVVEEAKAHDLESYRGHHYPASDIPAQARRLYVLNWLRIIPDVAYVPVPLIPALSPGTGQPLDLSLATLRSVSPVHVEYLRNMGVRASMSISLVRGQELWGLFACHHREPRCVPFVVRSACELIGRLVSLQAAALAEIEAAGQRKALRDVEATLIEAVRSDPGGWADGLASRTTELLRIVNATGAAICDGQEIRRVGATPCESDIRGIVAWLSLREAGLFETQALPGCYAPARKFSGLASGLLAITIPKPIPSYILWFRYEVPKTVTWSGDPSKPVESSPDRDRIHPRRSFAVWLEDVRGVSAPWMRAEIEIAEDVRQHAIEIDLSRQVARAERAIRARDDVVAIVSHDLKNPLSVILTATRLIQKGIEPTRGTAMVERIQDAVSRMNRLVSDLLDLGKIEAGGFAVHLARCDAEEVVADAIALFAPLVEERGIVLEGAVAPDTYVMGDRDRLHQVLANLVGNAIKFTPRGAAVRIAVSAEGGYARFAVHDMGPGIAEADQAQLFDRYWRGTEPRPQAGTGLGLYIAKGIVEAHGGRIWAESALGRGSTFAFTIPRT